MRRVVLALSLLACRSETASPVANTPPAGTSLADSLDRAKAANGDVLLVSGEDGLVAYTPDLERVAKLTSAHARHVHADPRTKSIYYFVERKLVRLDLATGHEQTVATLPALQHVCFGFDGTPVDPTKFVQRDGDVTVDVEHGYACLVAQDRNLNMMSVAVMYRIALATGAVDQRTTFTLDTCRAPGETESAEAPCQTDEMMMPPDTSASKRWKLLRDPDLGEQGDYIYSATFVSDEQAHKTYAVRADGLRELDYAAAKAAGKAPEGTCMLPFEALVQWFPHADALIVTDCGDSGAMIVKPPGTVHTIAGDDYAFY